jgi:hypothetical protein
MLASASGRRHIWRMFIQTEPTPNPQVLKFLPGRDVFPDGSRDFRDAEEAEASPLASELFAIDGVDRVYFGGDFVTVGKAADQDWALLKAPILAAIMDHFTAGRPLFREGETTAGHAEGAYEGDVAQIVAEIKDLLDTRIRFDVNDGVVYLNMKGACSGCPSSTATLKAGVENLLKHYVPEVTRVEQAV